MVFWILAITVTAIACAALYYAAAGRAVNAPGVEVGDATTGHFKQQLGEIEADLASGRLTAAEAVAAKGELARELIRLKQESAGAVTGAPKHTRWLIPGGMVLVVVLSFASYLFLGQPNLPSLPLSGRADVAAQSIDLDVAIKRIETQLAANPDDLRGWSVIGPAYMQLGRIDDAIGAFRRVLELSPPTADTETDLGEALMLKAEGNMDGEPLALMQSAAARDPAHIRSRFYLASNATQTGAWDEAIERWQGLIAMGKGDEPWMATARDGLAAAEAGRDGTAPAPAIDSEQAVMIAGMVQGLSDRLMAEGGTLEEWTRLVRSYLVLDQKDLAQKAYDAAKLAYPQLMERAELDALAKEGGLS